MSRTRETGKTNRIYFACRYIVLAVLAASLLAYPMPPARAADDFQEEINIGREAAEQVAKESKFIDDPVLVKRVESIGKAISKVAGENEVPATYGKATVARFDYSFKIVDDDEINAFALPGGFVYVTDGLLNYVQSDDELAGIIAHEIAHVSHHHAMQLMKSQQKEMTKLALAMLLGVAAGAGTGDVGDLAYVLTLISVAKLSAYGQKAESDADRTAVAYLADTPYNPVGMLTAMERFARDEARRPQINYSIFATHPPSRERARGIIEEINKLGIPINRRLVTAYARVQVRPVQDSQASAVWIADTEVIRLADSGGERAAARAERVAAKLSSLLLAGARIHDVKIGGGGQYVVLMGNVLISPTPEDVALAGSSVSAVTASAANAIKKALVKELLEQKY